MRSEVDRAYMAGLFDGEGHIGISHTTTRNGTRRHMLTLVLCNTHIASMEAMAALWGGYVQYRQPARTGHKPSATVHWTVHAGHELLRAIQPYLRIKTEQCRIALEFAATVNPPEHRGRWLAPGVWDNRERLRVEMAALNGRERTAQPAPAGTRPPLTCQYCGEAFDSYQRLRKYCSLRCNQLAGKQAYYERTLRDARCSVCGNEFRARQEQRFCSRACANTVNPPPINDRGSKRREIICATCGAAFLGLPARKFCSVHCATRASLPAARRGRIKRKET